ncbi:hypothetical protein Tco_0743808 [Tanacetum coccineum]
MVGLWESLGLMWACDELDSEGLGMSRGDACLLSLTLFPKFEVNTSSELVPGVPPELLYYPMFSILRLSPE